MKFLDKKEKEIIYNLCIQLIHRKHHLHHKIVTTTETIHAPFSAYMQQGSSSSSLTRLYMYD